MMAIELVLMSAMRAYLLTPIHELACKLAIWSKAITGILMPIVVFLSAILAPLLIVQLVNVLARALEPRNIPMVTR